VADERVEAVGESVGYQIRLEAKRSKQTRLLFCTIGILLRRLETDPLLRDVSHVVVDEVHERSLESDFLLMVLREVMKSRPEFKVVLMSATVDHSLFSDYFGGADACPVLDIPGRAFPVQGLFLEDALEVTRFVVERQSVHALKGSSKPTQSTSSKQSPAGVDSGANSAHPPISAAVDGDGDDDADGRVDGEGINDDDATLDIHLNEAALKARYPGRIKSSYAALQACAFDEVNLDLVRLSV
jgi:ATP-dependent RNA helicase DHX57